MPTYRIDLAYDGSGFRGYARQDGQRTVQGGMEAALAVVLGATPETAVAGRTDTGVHALGQVASFEHPQTLDVADLARSLNGLLGPEVAVWGVSVAADGFHARHSARWRRYRYRMGTGSATNPLTRGYTWEVGRHLDVVAMTQAAGAFLGENDFSSFCRSVEGRSNVRRVDESRVAVDGEVLEYWVTANAFCHQMVRSMVGHLYDIGRGHASARMVGEVIAARDRGRVATVAPPHGLTLMQVGY